MSSSRENLSDHDLLPAGRSGMSLIVSGCGVAVYPPGATFGPRRLQDFEFVWLLQGTAEWWYDLGTIALGTSSLLLGRPGITDSFIWDRTRPTRHAYLHFQLVGQRVGLPDPARWPLVRTLPDDDPLRPLLRYLLRLDQQRPSTHQQTTTEVLGLLLTLFVQGPLPDRDEQRLPPHLDTLVEFVRRVWSPPAPTRPLSLRELAAGACLSNGYLSRVFRQHYGIGPVAAFELLRLARAATLLSAATSASPRSPTTAALPTLTTSRAASTGATASRPDATAAPRHACNRPSRSHKQGCSTSTTTSGGRPSHGSSRSAGELLLCTKQEDTPGWSVQMLKEPAVSPSHPVRPWCQTVAQRPVMPSSGCLRERGHDFGRADRGVGQDTPETGNQ
jgi:AraC-like DNA-binding protein